MSIELEFLKTLGVLFGLSGIEESEIGRAFRFQEELKEFSNKLSEKICSSKGEENQLDSMRNALRRIIESQERKEKTDESIDFIIDKEKDMKKSDKIIYLEDIRDFLCDKIMEISGEGGQNNEG